MLMTPSSRGVSAVVSTRPKGTLAKGWRFFGVVPVVGYSARQWAHESGIGVLSAVEMVEQNPPGSGIVMPHYHVSATHQGGVPRACTDQEMEEVRAAFDMGGAEEDNHGPGIARHLWIMVGRDREPECPCKQDEDRIVEGDRVRYEEGSALASPEQLATCEATDHWPGYAQTILPLDSPEELTLSLDGEEFAA